MLFLILYRESFNITFYCSFSYSFIRFFEGLEETEIKPLGNQMSYTYILTFLHDLQNIHAYVYIYIYIYIVYILHI